MHLHFQNHQHTRTIGRGKSTWELTDNPWNPTQNAQKNVDQQMAAASCLQEYGEKGEEDGN